MEYIRLNTILQPPENISKKIVALSKELGDKYQAHFVLDNQNFYPHFTVYSPEYPADKLEQIIDILGSLSFGFDKIDLIFDKILVNQGYLGLGFKVTPEVQKLHETIVKALNPLREGHLRKKYEAPDYRMKLSPEKIDNIAKYGYPSAMNLYHPHMTIIRLKDEKQAEKAAKNLVWQDGFSVDKLALFKMGEHGTCTELVKEFELK